MKTAPVRRLTPLQEDGVVYKVMAAIVVAVFALPIAYALTTGSGVPANIRILVGVFAFDAGWDLTLLATGRGEMLQEPSPRLIVGKALERTVPIGLALLFFSLEGDARLLVISIFVIWGVAGLLSTRRAG